MRSATRRSDGAGLDLRTPQPSEVPIRPRSNLFDRARSQALRGAGGSLAGGVGGARTGSASFRLLATAACSARAACRLRSFSTAVVQVAVFAAAALSLRSIYLLRSFSIAFPQVLEAATRSLQSLSIGVAMTGK